MWEKSNLYRKIWEASYGRSSAFQFFDAAKDNKALVQRLQLQVKLPVHKGCVNTICWNDSGEYILSGSDDQHLCITNGYSHEISATLQTGHKANIFSAKFLPNTSDRQVISCSGDGMIIYTNLEHPKTSLDNIFNCHFGTAYEITTVPNDPHTFLSCGEDGTVRWFDLRMKNHCSLEECKEDILISCRCAVTSIAVNPLMPYQLGVGCGDSSVRVFDRRMLGTRATGNYTGNGIQAMTARFTVPEFDGRTHRITSLCYSPDGREMLVSYSSDYIYLFSIQGDTKDSPTVLNSRSKESRKEQGGRSRSSRHPVMKRLRVRGDWSDTGPNARPESEMRASGEQQPRSLHASLMQRMSDVLTRMFTGPAGPLQATASPAHSDRDGSSDEDHEHPRRVLRPGRNRLDMAQESLSAEGSASASAEESRHESEAASSFSAVAQTETETCPDVFLPVTSESDSPSACCPESEDLVQDLSVDSAASKDISNVAPHIEPEETATCSNAPAVSTEQPDAEILTAEQAEQDAGGPGNALFNQSLQNLEQELSTQRRDFLEKHNVEPMVNLCYTGQSMNSGLITMGVSSNNELEEFQVPANASSTQESPQDAVLQDADHNSDRASELRQSSANIQENIVITTTDEVQPMIIDQSCNDVPSSSQIQTDSTMPSEQIATSEASAGTSETRGNSRSEITRTGVELELHSAERRNLSQIEEENEAPFLMEVERWDADSSSEDESSSRSQPEQSTSKPPPHTSNPPGNFMKMLRERRREKAQLMSVPQPSVKQKYMGHRNARTMIKEATFWGNDFVMSGSDCGYIFVWNRYTAELVMLMEGDQHVVNCLQPHPFDPILASSGIDYDVKLWAPLHEEPAFDEEHAQKVIRRNEVMLEETKDTITVPASFMIRMLASLNHLRSAGSNPSWRRARESRTDDSDSSNQ